MVGRRCERSVHPPVVRSKYAEYRTNQCGLRVAVLGTRVFIRSTGACFPTLRVPSVPAPASRTPRGRVPLLPCPMLPSLRSSALRSFVGRPSVLQSFAVRSSLVRVSVVRSTGVRSLAGCRPSLSGPSARPKNSTAPWRSDCGRVDYARTDSRSSDLGVSEPVPSLSVPLVSVLWLEPTLRNPVFAYPAIRSPLLCWCCLSQSGLSRWPGKPGDRLVGSTESPNKKHHPDSNP